MELYCIKPCFFRDRLWKKGEKLAPSKAELEAHKKAKEGKGCLKYFMSKEDMKGIKPKNSMLKQSQEPKTLKGMQDKKPVPAGPGKAKEEPEEPGMLG